MKDEPKSLDTNEAGARIETTAPQFSFPTQIPSRHATVWFMLAAFSIVAFIFYNTEFRDVLEDWFFDARTRWAPSESQTRDIVVVAIDEIAIQTLDAEQSHILFDGRRRPYLSIDALTKVTGLLANSDASAIAVLLPNHATAHNDERLREFTEIIRFDQRMLIGTTEYNRPEPGVTKIPFPLKAVEDRVFGYETFRKRSNVIVRSLPYTGYRGLSEELMLPVKLASVISGNFGELEDRYMLNALAPSAFQTVSAALAVTNPRNFLESVRGKIAILGYTVNREIPFQTTDMMLVNTPVVGNVQNVDNGISMTYLVANGVENLIHNRYLRPANSVFNFIQTIAVAAICGLVWELGSFVASLFTLAFWALLIYLHAYVFTYLNYIVPLADTFLASSLVAIFAAVRRLRMELREMAAQKAATDSKGEIARIQSLFLDDFATWLKSMTSLIVATMRRTQATAVASSPANADLYQRAFTAGEDFSEYLESIRQIPAFENVDERPKKQTIDIEELCRRITRRFESKMTDKSLKLQFDVSENASTVKANLNLLDSIVFNFVSNAIKYSPPNSAITIRSHRSKDNRVIISVIDEGPGIPDDKKEKIFEKFYRIQDDRLYNTRGTGLGLYLCRFFAERMGGSVQVRTPKSGGSEFRVVLP